MQHIIEILVENLTTIIALITALAAVIVSVVTTIITERWRAKQKALEKRFGSFEVAYNNLTCMLKMLQDRNPGMYITVQDKPSTSPLGYEVL